MNIQLMERCRRRLNARFSLKLRDRPADDETDVGDSSPRRAFIHDPSRAAFPKFVRRRLKPRGRY